MISGGCEVRSRLISYQGASLELVAAGGFDRDLSPHYRDVVYSVD